MVSGMSTFGSVVLLLIFITSEFLIECSYVCPQQFVAIGKKCYYFSKDETIWHEAHFRCESFNSSLAAITSSRQELMVRRYLNKRVDGRYERWLGGRYNERQRRWEWGENGKPLIFQAFSRTKLNDTAWAWHCIIVDPQRHYKWTAKSCVEPKRYICQRPVLGKKKDNRNRCHNTNKELCLKQRVGHSAPAFLVKKSKKVHRSYQLATFVCPDHMILVGRKCYFFSLESASWSNAYWACKDNKTSLAVISNKLQDNILRGFLRASFTAEKHERWIGGIYDWKQQNWKWAVNARPIKYTNFAENAMVDKKNNTHHCITLDPLYNNLWNSKNRMELKHYICQAKSKSVVKYNKLPQPDATVVIAAKKTNNAYENTTFKDRRSQFLNVYNNEVTEK